MKQVRDQLGAIAAATIDDATVSVEIYNGAFPTGTLYKTLSGSLISGSQIDFYAIWPDTDSSTGTDSLTNNQDLWAKFIVTVTANAKGVAFAKLKAVGA